MPHFSQNLKSWRLHRSFTQEELARRSGIPRPNLVGLERGTRECTLSTLNRLASALEASPGSLLDRVPPGRSPQLLNRHQIDSIARNVLTGKGNLPGSLLKIRDQAMPEVGPLLRVAGVRRKGRLSKRQNPLDREGVEQVLARISKLLPSVLLRVSL